MPGEDRRALRELLGLALPAALQEAVNISYWFIDSLFLSRLGEEAFSAPVLSWPIIYVFYLGGVGLLLGGTALVSQSFGFGDAARTRRSAGAVLLASLLASIPLTLVPLAARGLLVEAMGVPVEMREEVEVYFGLTLLGIPLGLGTQAYAIISNALGDTRTPLLIELASTIFNLALDPLLIFGLLGAPAMGVAGAAIATVAARGLALSLGLRVLFASGVRGLRISPRDLAPDSRSLILLARVGLPLAATRVLNALAGFVFVSLVARAGPAAVAAYGSTDRIMQLVMIGSTGLQRASAAMIGQRIGAGDGTGARRLAAISSRVMATYMAAWSAILLASSRELTSFFLSSGESLAEGARLLSLVALTLPLLGLHLVMEAVARGSGRTVYYMLTVVVRLWAVRIGLGLALLESMGPLGLWLAASLSNAVAGALAVPWITSGLWAARIIESNEREKNFSPR
ncbi:MAG: MATE family efflux transporter [Fervidicoccaceae archaeon]